MNTLQKSLPIAFLTLLIFISGLNIDIAGAQNRTAGTAETQRSADPLLSRYLRFGRLTTEDGLSGDQAYHIAQDGYGFMWFSTANGLSRYDGSSVKVYRNDANDPNSLSHNLAWSAVEDQAGVFCISTEASRFRRRALCV